MPHPKLNKKTFLIIGVGVLAVLLYMHYKSSSSASTTAPADTLGTVGTDPNAQYGYGSGSASDVGNTQAANLSAQEASDVAGLTGQIGTVSSNVTNLAAQEQSDIASINANIAASSGQYAGQFAGIASQLTGFQSALAAQAAQVAQGQGKASPAAVAPPPASIKPGNVYPDHPTVTAAQFDAAARAAGHPVNTRTQVSVVSEGAGIGKVPSAHISAIPRSGSTSANAPRSHAPKVTKPTKSGGILRG